MFPRIMQPHRPLGIWLAIWAAMLFLLIVIGGATRLTESGLSITEWKVVSGVVPPLSAAEWDAEWESPSRSYVGSDELWILQLRLGEWRRARFAYAERYGWPTDFVELIREHARTRRALLERSLP